MSEAALKAHIWVVGSEEPKYEFLTSKYVDFPKYKAIKVIKHVADWTVLWVVIWKGGAYYETVVNAKEIPKFYQSEDFVHNYQYLKALLHEYEKRPGLGDGSSIQET